MDDQWKNRNIVYNKPIKWGNLVVKPTTPVKSTKKRRQEKIGSKIKQDKSKASSPNIT